MANILSTAENNLYRREKFMAVVPSQKYGEDAWIDPLDPRIQQLLKKAKVLTYFTYRGEPITSVSYEFYGNTTLYWVILMVNGYLFADDIPHGTKLKIPDVSDMTKNARPGQPVSNRTGTVVRA